MSSDLKSNSYQKRIKEDGPPDLAVYEFEDFRLDAAHLMLYRGIAEISLTRKQVETLLALVERSGEIVSRDELMDRVWANAFVEESNLNQNIYVLRKTLGESANGKPLIETLHRRGYRFNGELKLKDQSTPSEVAELPRSNSPQLLRFPLPVVKDPSTLGGAVGVPTWGRKRTIGTFAIVGSLIVAIGLTYYFFAGPKTAPGSNRSIAVLPLKPIDPANRSDLYEIGIADSLINRLNSIPGFIVRPLSSTRKYTDVGQDPVAAGREQKVDYVLASNYQLADGRIRITSQLINATTGQTEESYQFDKEASSVFAIQDAVTGEVAKKLMTRFDSASVGRAAKRGTSDEKAYRLYLDGMYFYDKGGAGLFKSIEKLDQAVELDSNYALAWAGKALVHTSILYVNSADTSKEYQRSTEAINRALVLDPDLPEAHSASCENKFSYEYDLVGAERECRRALEIDPNSSIAHQIYARFLGNRGRHDEAIAEIKTAIELAPTSYFNQRMYANLLYFARRYEQAEAQYKQIIGMDDQDPATYEWFVRTLEMQGKESEAFEWFDRSLTIRETEAVTIQRYRTAYETSGWKGVLLERDRASSADANPNYFRRAGWNARLGNKDKALEDLETSFQRHQVILAALEVEPLFDLVRDDPRYIELAGRIRGRSERGLSSSPP